MGNPQSTIKLGCRCSAFAIAAAQQAPVYRALNSPGLESYWPYTLTALRKIGVSPLPLPLGL